GPGRHSRRRFGRLAPHRAPSGGFRGAYLAWRSRDVPDALGRNRALGNPPPLAPLAYRAIALRPAPGVGQSPFRGRAPVGRRRGLARGPVAGSAYEGGLASRRSRRARHRIRFGARLRRGGKRRLWRGFRRHGATTVTVTEVCETSSLFMS